MGNFFFLSKNKKQNYIRIQTNLPRIPQPNNQLKMHLLRNNFLPLKKKAYPCYIDILFNKYYYLFKKNRNVYPILVVCV